jgi:hypothetical protein
LKTEYCLKKEGVNLGNLRLKNCFCCKIRKISVFSPKTQKTAKKHAQKCTEMHRFAQKCTEMHENAQFCTKMHKFAQLCTAFTSNWRTNMDSYTPVYLESIPQLKTKN